MAGTSPTGEHAGGAQRGGGGTGEEGCAGWLCLAAGCNAAHMHPRLLSHSHRRRFLPLSQLPGGALPALPQYLALIRQCWAPDPAARPSFEQVAAALRRIAETLPEPEAEEE